MSSYNYIYILYFFNFCYIATNVLSKNDVVLNQYTTVLLAIAKYWIIEYIVLLLPDPRLLIMNPTGYN